MRWKESSVMEERLRFVARLLEGEPMSEVCRDFGVSRKTGYKLLNRYREEGPPALCDQRVTMTKANAGGCFLPLRWLRTRTFPGELRQVFLRFRLQHHPYDSAERAI